MNTKNKVTSENFFDLLHESVQEGTDHAKGKITLKTEALALPDDPPLFSGKKIKEIREILGVSQPVFGKVMGCGSSAIKSWEQGLQRPNGVARRLLQLVAGNPEMVLKVLQKQTAAKKKISVRRTAKKSVKKA